MSTLAQPDPERFLYEGKRSGENEKKIERRAKLLALTSKIGAVQARVTSWHNLPSLPEGFEWRPCNGAVLSKQISPIASQRLSGRLPKIAPGATVTAPGNYGYKEAHLGDTGRGAVLCAKGDFLPSMPGETSQYYMNARPLEEDGGRKTLFEKGSYKTPAISPSLPHAYDHNASENHSSHVHASTEKVVLDLSNTLYRDSSESDHPTPFQDKAKGVVPAHIGVNFYTIIDVGPRALAFLTEMQKKGRD